MSAALGVSSNGHNWTAVGQPNPTDVFKPTPGTAYSQQVYPSTLVVDSGGRFLVHASTATVQHGTTGKGVSSIVTFAYEPDRIAAIAAPRNTSSVTVRVSGLQSVELVESGLALNADCGTTGSIRARLVDEVEGTQLPGFGFSGTDAMSECNAYRLPLQWRTQHTEVLPETVTLELELSGDARLFSVHDGPEGIALAARIHVDTPKMGGSNFLSGQWSGPAYNSSEAYTSLGTLQSTTDANWIALTYCHFIKSVDSTGPIYARPSTPTPEELTQIVAKAHSKGIKVLFRPCIDPDWSNPATKGTWRGQIGRKFSAAEWAVWFNNYEPFIVAQARLASGAGADMFSVGMEYIDMSNQEAGYRSVIAAAKSVYSGPITYCANHGQEHNIKFWDAVDQIGVDAYYTLDGSNTSPTVDDLVKAWSPIAQQLESLSTQWNRPLFFAEIGFCSSTGTNSNPAGCGGDGAPLNLQAQANAYSAFFQALWGQDWFSGVFWWAWNTDTSNGGPSDTGFSPNGKPAASVMKQYYSQLSE